MSRILFLFAFLLCLLQGMSQNLSVASFKSLPNDLDARVNFPKKDQNGDVCAIIKVVTTETGFSWDGDQLGITKVESKVGEYWLYVPYGAKRLTIKHPQLGLLRDYRYEEAIQKATVYELVLISGKVTTSIVPAAPVWLTIRSNPAGADVYINGVLKGITPLPVKLLPGKHIYRVEKPMYHIAAGTAEITGMEKDGKRDLPLELKPAFGSINIYTSPLQGATVLIDDTETGKTTPFSMPKIKSGTHKITVRKDNFQPKSVELLIKDGQLTEDTIALSSTGVYVTLNASNDADIYIDGAVVGRGTYQGQIPAGVSTFEAKKEGYYSDKKDKDLAVGESITINLAVQPIVGSLDVVSSPMDATVFLNGEQKGTTPITLKNLMVGKYELKLEKEGYFGSLNDITITENKTAEVNEKLLVRQEKTAETVTTETKKEPEKQAPIKTVDKKADKPLVIPANKPIYHADYYKYRTQKTFWLTSTLVLAGVGTFSYLKYEKFKGLYKEAASNTDAATFQSKYELFDKLQTYAFSLAGFCAIEFVIKASKQSKAKKQTVGISPQPIEHGAGLNLVYKF